MTSTADAHAFREPKQERSRIAWERALDAGLALLEQRGLEAVTVTEVCRRAGISAPSLYARVDGRAGLVAAVYEHGMTALRATEAELLERVPPVDAPVEDRIAAIVAYMAGVFRRHRTLMRPIIASSTYDEHIHARGVEESLRSQQVMVDALGLPDDVGHDIAAMIFAEVVVRTVYGGEFSATTPETDEEFEGRLTRMGVARANGV